MRPFYFLFSLVILSAILLLPACQGEKASHQKKYSKEERIEGYIEHLLLTSSDVKLGYVPIHKLMDAISIGKARAEEVSRRRSFNGSLVNAIWRERGPVNIGGRTRTIMIDQSDPSGNRIWVGSVSGGVWRTEDITQDPPAWEHLAFELDNIAIGCIAQDPNNHDVVYVGTGEGFPNVDAVTGAGIFKTTDDGLTWSWLPSTQNSSFVNVHEVYVHQNGDIYACTQVDGILRSKDQGNSWEKVLGKSLNGSTNNNFYDFHYNKVNQTFYASNENSLFKSTNGNRGQWTNIGTSKPGFASNLVRCEFAVCASDPNVIYVIGNTGNGASSVYISNSGGESWINRPAPTNDEGNEFTNGQAWYDLDIAADPFNCGRIIAGGVPLFESDFQAINWSQIGGGFVHVDQHLILFDPDRQGRVFFGNDGGIWFSQNGGASISNKNLGYVTTQFYAGAIHPEAGSPYLLGGTQDNNSLQITEAGLSPGNSVKGGDGVYCFIDQNEPHIQIVSSQGGNYSLSLDGGNDFDNAIDVEGSFINRSGYDDEANILYGQVSGADFFRWNVNTFALENVDVMGQSMSVGAVKADPNTPNRIYFGTGGRVVRVDNAHEGTSVQGTTVGSFSGGATISSIYLDRLDTNHILVSLYNYGVQNLHVTYDGGNEWMAIDGDLPDMPVRWALFDPANHDRAMIATEAGVWVTDDINGANTQWFPIPPANGMPFVKVDMLLMRESDKVVLAATHGRGLFTTDVFSAPAPVILAQTVGYEGHTIRFDGSQSVNAQEYEWDLGDNTQSTAAVIDHTYDEPGTYNVSLTVNGSVKETTTIYILPQLPAPYKAGEANYTGDFESAPDHFASPPIQGTYFQRGSSTFPGKDGALSGTNAWVLGINEPLYQNNSRAELYTPMFDLSEQGLYELRYWSKFAIQNRNDGFQVEYSTDAGATWHQLGDVNSPNWYNYYNANIVDGAFPQGKSYFTNAQLNWTQYIKDISFLAGSSHVSFRFLFRSDDETQAQGLAIDDFEVTRFEGELKTTLTQFTGAYTGDDDITLEWTTSIEYHCQEFILEKSYFGFSFTEPSHTIPAKGGVSSFPNFYSFIDHDLKDVIYYRLRVINKNADPFYDYEFISDTIIVIRDVEPGEVNYVLPNPFYKSVGVSFNSVVDQETNFRLFDASGKLIREEKVVPLSSTYFLDDLLLPTGVYFLTVKIGDGDERTYRLFSMGRG